MGMGNLENVLEDFGGGRRSYAELYFDSTPLRHPTAQQRLAGFGDDSSNYYWKLLAARDIMRGSDSRPGPAATALLEAALPQGDLRAHSAGRPGHGA